MGGNTGNFRTLRNQSGTNGSRTIFSILASDGGSGAGSVRRVYGYYAKNRTVADFYKNVFDMKYGKLKNQSQWILSNNFA